MSKIKEFWNDHKLEISLIGGGCVLIAVGTIGTILTRHKFVVDLNKENCIHWTPTDKVMNLERVKEILDANKDNLSQFAIFREGPNPDEYVTIVMKGSESFVDP